MSRRVPLLLVFAVLTILWMFGHAHSPRHATAAAAEQGDTLAVAERAPESGIVAARLRTPVSAVASIAPRRTETGTLLQHRLLEHTAGHHRHAPLYTLLRAYRI